MEINIPKPCSALLIDGKEVEIFRCETDGGLVFNHQSLLRHHPGHRFRSPVGLKDGEMEEIGKLWAELTQNGGENKTNE